MDVIFHEKQQGSLCAQHCLNALLQGQYFTAVDLATIGRRMDDAERQHMAEGAGDSEEFQRFLQQPSNNVDDSGYFSVQVIAEALSVWGLDLVPFSSSDARASAARLNPTNENAFICHYRDHWLAVRRLGRQWFDLNSLLPGPQLLSDTYLALYLAQLQQDRYSIFIVVGDLPDCEAHRRLLANPLPAELCRVRPPPAATPAADEDDDQLRAVLELSRRELDEEDENRALETAILQSLRAPTLTAVTSAATSAAAAATPTPLDAEEEELRRAIALSLEASTPPATSTPEDVEFIRRRRLMRLEP